MKNRALVVLLGIVLCAAVGGQGRALRFAGLTHTALGTVRLTIGGTQTSEALTLERIGWSGQDGVRIAAPDTALLEWNVLLTPSFGVASASAGALIRTSAVAREDDTCRGANISATMHHVSRSTLEISADLGPAEGQGARYVLYRDGKRLKSVVGRRGEFLSIRQSASSAGSPASSVAQTSLFPREHGLTAENVQDPLTWLLRWDNPVIALLPDGTELSVDEVRIEAQSPGVSCFSFSLIDLRAQGMDSLTVDRETVVK